ncbi:MAG TPA: hypothetical protein VFY41_09395 [Nitrososphaeraceae archaeon]|nr:hypothetical protein [Nitrososphaeraceae archaeon]
MADWTLDVFFKRDVTILRSFVGKEEERIPVILILIKRWKKMAK